MNWRLLICSLVLGLLPLIALADTLVVAGTSLRLPTPLISKGDDVLAPVIPALRLLGASVTLRESAILITTPDGAVIKMSLESTRAAIDGKRMTLPAAPCLVGDTVYLPLKWLAPLLHAAVHCANGGQTVVVQPLLDVRYEARPEGLAVLVRDAAGLQFHYREQADGGGAYIDFKNAALGENTREIPVNSGRVARIRLAPNHLTPSTVRVSLDFSDPSSISTTVGEDGRLATILVTPKIIPLVPPPGTPGTTEPAPATPLVPAKLLSVELTKQTARQSELLIATDGPTHVATAYDGHTRQLTLTVANGLSSLDDTLLREIHDKIVCKVEANGDGKTPGTVFSISLRQDAGYFVQQEAKDIRVLIGSFDISDMTIVLDPGHGDHDTGAIGVNGNMEKSVTLAVGLKAAQALRAAGAKVLMTREDDTFIPLDDRPALANDNQASLFISIHCNSTPTPNSASGTQTYYHTPQSAALAAAMHGVLIKELGLNNGGVHVANFLVIRKAEMPSILIEMGFINNSDEEALLINPDFQQKAANAILDGVRAYAAAKDWQLHKMDHPDILPVDGAAVTPGERSN